MKEPEWTPRRAGLRFIVERLAWWDAFGSGYVYARERGRIARFWRRSSAQALADTLNGGAT